MIAQFPSLAMKNRQLVEQSTNAGCYCCLKIFDSKEIKEYTDEGQTAVCPYCEVDAVVGDMCGFVLNEEILKKAQKYWFAKK